MNELQQLNQAYETTNALKTKAPSPNRVNLYRIGWLRPIFESRWPQYLLRAVTLAGFVFAIITALFGSTVGSHNFAIIFVWIAWWSAFKLIFIPFGGRVWCSICPIPLPGEWLQQGGILQKGHRLGLNLHWPKRLKGMWLQSGTFLLIGLFSAFILTVPHVTGWVLLALFGLAMSMSLVFENRTFCRYICPIGGFSGIYAQTSPVELRVIDTDICARHSEKSCYYACPWGLYPVALRDSSTCGLCMECLRICPKDNLALNLRPFSADIGKTRKSNRLDEAFLALVMLGSVITFSTVFIGQWGWLKWAAFKIGSWAWWWYAASFLALNLLILPVLFAFAVWTGSRKAKFKLSFLKEISNQSQALLPLGLMAWIAFTVSFALPKFNYILGVINDPFGWGWKLLGNGYTALQLDLNGFITLTQVISLGIGMFWSSKVANQLANFETRRALPLQLFNLVFTLTMLWLLIG